MKKTCELICVAFLVFSAQGCALFGTHKPEQAVWNMHNNQALAACTGSFMFRAEFMDILDNLLTNHWDPSGNWDGDMQGDATLFASMLLFALGNDARDPFLVEMAQRTVSYEASLVRKFFIFPVVRMDMVIGFPALAQRYIHTGDDASRFVFLSGVRSGNIMISLMPGVFVSFMHDPATLYGTTSYLCFLAYEISETDFQKRSFRKKALAWIEKAEKECWNEETGLYDYANILDWPQTTMMMALASAYKSTGEAWYLDRCLTVMESMDELCLDREWGGYRGHPDLTRKGLSGNNNMIWALLDLFEITGDRQYLDRARSVLEWILSEDLYDAGDRIIYHHWDETQGRAGYFCTGCNFQTLYNIYRFNTLRQVR